MLPEHPFREFCQVGVRVGVRVRVRVRAKVGVRFEAKGRVRIP